MVGPPGPDGPTGFTGPQGPAGGVPGVTHAQVGTVSMAASSEFTLTFEPVFPYVPSVVVTSSGSDVSVLTRTAGNCIIQTLNPFSYSKLLATTQSTIASLATVGGKLAIMSNNSADPSMLILSLALNTTGTLWEPNYYYTDPAGRIGGNLFVLNTSAMINVASTTLIGGNLCFVSSNGPAFGFNPSKILDSTAQPTSMAIITNHLGAPMILYNNRSTTGGGVTAITAIDSGGAIEPWNKTATLDTTNGGLCQFICLSRAGDTNNNVGVYYDGSNAIRCVYSPTNIATLNSTGLVISGVGQVTSLSLCLVSDWPAIAYTVGGNIYFLRSTSVTGGDWAGSQRMTVELSTLGFAATSVSMSVIGTLPAITYHDAVHKTLRIIRSVDAQGTNWESSSLVDSLGGNHPSMQAFNSDYGIAYIDNHVHPRFISPTSTQPVDVSYVAMTRY